MKRAIVVFELKGKTSGVFVEEMAFGLSFDDSALVQAAIAKCCRLISL